MYVPVGKLAARPVRLIVAAVPAQIAELAAVDDKIYVVQVTGAGLNANKMEPFRSLLDNITVLVPVDPAVGFIAQAPPIEDFVPLEC